MTEESTFIDLLKFRFQDSSRAAAIRRRQESMTYGQLAVRIEGAAAFLQARGLKAGDVVALFTAERLPFLIVHLGVMLAGGISLPLNFNFTAAEMIYFLNDSKARFVCADSGQAELIRRIEPQCPRLEVVFDSRQALETTPGRRFREREVKAADPCFMLYSSGTTGQPKGVVHTQENTAASLLALQKQWRFTADDVLLNVLPLFHIHGLSFAAHLSLLSGSTMIVADPFHPRRTLAEIEEATVFMGVPPYYYSFLNRKEFPGAASRWQRLRLLTCGSAPIRPEVLPRLEAATGHPVINRYGMTESHVITSLPLEGPYVQGSVGLPLEGIEIKLEGDKETAGEVKIRGRNLFHHYWGRPEATRDAFDSEGFFNTGDLGYFDEQGFLVLAGRRHDLIITGGYNVYPPVVEQVINSFPGIRESAVIGIPDDLKGEKVAAVVVADRAIDLKELNRFCRSRLVAYQCPARFVISDSLPRNTMGKVLKRSLRERFL